MDTRRIKAGDDIFFTLSMAEVLEKQGRLEDALMIYKILADTSPGDKRIQERMERLTKMAKLKRSFYKEG